MSVICGRTERDEHQWRIDDDGHEIALWTTSTKHGERIAIDADVWGRTKAHIVMERHEVLTLAAWLQARLAEMGEDDG